MNSALGKLTIALSAIILTSLAISSCDSVLNQNSPTTNQAQDVTSQANNVQSQKSQSLNHDQKMARLAKEIPGLGGLFINESGLLSIYLTQPIKQRAQAAAIFSSFKPLTNTLDHLRAMGQKYGMASVASMKAITGEYTFIQLYKWKKRLLATSLL